MESKSHGMRDSLSLLVSKRKEPAVPGLSNLCEVSFDADICLSSRVRHVKPRNCSRFVQNQLAKSLPAICAGLLEKARQGDVASVRMLWAMAGFGQRTAKVEGRSHANYGLAFARKVLNEFENDGPGTNERYNENEA